MSPHIYLLFLFTLISLAPPATSPAPDATKAQLQTYLSLLCSAQPDSRKSAVEHLIQYPCARLSDLVIENLLRVSACQTVASKKDAYTVLIACPGPYGKSTIEYLLNALRHEDDKALLPIIDRIVARLADQMGADDAQLVEAFLQRWSSYLQKNARPAGVLLDCLSRLKMRRKEIYDDVLNAFRLTKETEGSHVIAPIARAMMAVDPQRAVAEFERLNGKKLAAAISAVGLYSYETKGAFEGNRDVKERARRLVLEGARSSDVLVRRESLRQLYFVFFTDLFIINDDGTITVHPDVQRTIEFLNGKESDEDNEKMIHFYLDENEIVKEALRLIARRPTSFPSMRRQRVVLHYMRSKSVLIRQLAFNALEAAFGMDLVVKQNGEYKLNPDVEEALRYYLAHEDDKALREIAGRYFDKEWINSYIKKNS